MYVKSKIVILEKSIFRKQVTTRQIL